MELVKFECTVCFDDKKEKDPQAIEKSLVCADCVKDGVLPMFERALEHEHNWPPTWGSQKLELFDYEYMILKHFGKQWRDSYIRRELEYKARVRVYCKHQVSARHALGPGAMRPPRSKLALSPQMIEICKAAGYKQIECGGFLASQVQLPSTIIECWRCGGKVCGACETPMYTKKDEEHTCDVANRANDIEKELGQVRGRDIQQCPNIDCRNIIALKDGCNHMKCPKCSTEFCFICGEPADVFSGHWSLGNPCPRWNQPDDDNAQHDEAFAPIEADDPEWRPIVARLRYLVMYRIESGVRMEEEWLYQIIIGMLEVEINEALHIVNQLFPVLMNIEPRPPLVPGVVVPITSLRGQDEVAMRAAEWHATQDNRPLPREWYRDLVRDLELRELTEEEYGPLVQSLRSLIPNNVRRSFTQGFFDIHANNAEAEIAGWALQQGLPVDDENVANLLRLYDDLKANVELTDVAVPDQDQIQEFRERHSAIVGAVAAVQRVEAGLIATALHELNDTLDDYLDRIPDWAEATAYDVRDLLE